MSERITLIEALLLTGVALAVILYIKRRLLGSTPPQDHENDRS